MISEPTSPVGLPNHSAKTEKLRSVATELEGVFLAEMLKSAGLGKMKSEFGGGVGEEQFSSFLVQQQARAFSETGGIGLAEQIFNALKRTDNGLAS